jgi:hypothetical protein
MIELLQEGIGPLGVITPIPWILLILHDVPGLGAGPKKFVKYCMDQVAARKKVGFLLKYSNSKLTKLQYTPDSPDVFSYLIDAEKQSNDPIHRDPR